MEVVIVRDADEDDAAGADGSLLATHCDAPATIDDVVDLVLCVRLLSVHRAGRPDGEAQAERACIEEVRVDVVRASVGGDELGYLEGVHVAQGSGCAAPGSGPIASMPAATARPRSHIRDGRPALRAGHTPQCVVLFQVTRKDILRCPAYSSTRPSLQAFASFFARPA